MSLFIVIVLIAVVGLVVSSALLATSVKPAIRQSGHHLLLASNIAVCLLFSIYLTAMSSATLVYGTPVVASSAITCRGAELANWLFITLINVGSLAAGFWRWLVEAHDLPSPSRIVALAWIALVWAVALSVNLPVTIIVTHFPSPTLTGGIPTYYKVYENYLNPPPLPPLPPPSAANRSLLDDDIRPKFLPFHEPNPVFITSYFGPFVSLLAPLLLALLYVHTFIKFRSAENGLRRALAQQNSNAVGTNIERIGVEPAAPSPSVVSMHTSDVRRPQVGPTSSSVVSKPLLRGALSNALPPTPLRNVTFDTASVSSVHNSIKAIKVAQHGRRIELLRKALVWAIVLVMQLPYIITSIRLRNRDRYINWWFLAVAYILHISVVVAYPILLLYAHPSLLAVSLQSTLAFFGPSQLPETARTTLQKPSLGDEEHDGVHTIRRGVSLDDFQAWWIRQQEINVGPRRMPSANRPRRGVEFPIENTSDLYTFSIESDARE
eukprot:jgi/Hompol1/4814/HPOL_003898-RA